MSPAGAISIGETQQPDYEYVAYIDESGDQGLEKVKPLDHDGSSEWLIISGLVIRKQFEPEVPHWTDTIRAELRSSQLRHLHFRKLEPDWRKATVCTEISKLPVRCFAVCSNKKNMKGYQNPFAAKVPSQSWFYCWMTRVLLERVTHFVAADARKRFGEVRRVKLIYSRAGGLRYPQMRAYYEWIREKRRGGHQILFWGDLEYETLHSHLMEVHDHRAEPGLCLSDAVASSFFKACDRHQTGACEPLFAKCLTKRMAAVPDKPDGQIAGYGLKLLPGWRKAALDSDQQQVFRHFGYPRQWWDIRWRPDPFGP